MSRLIHAIRIGFPVPFLAMLACSEPTAPLNGTRQPQLNAAAVTSITACGTVISAPGTYAVTQDLTGCPGHGIVILASNVVLRLNGHTLRGLPNSAYGINVGAAGNFHGGVSGVDIEGPGTIEFFLAGVSFEQVSGSKLRGITSRFNLHGLTFNRSYANGDLIPSRNDSIVGNRFINNRAHGVTINGGANSVFSGNLSNENGLTIGGMGFYLFLAERITVENNQARGNGNNGVYITGESHVNTVRSNTAIRNRAGDMFDANSACDRNTWTGNTFGSANQACIQ